MLNFNSFHSLIVALKVDKGVYMQHKGLNFLQSFGFIFLET